MTVLVIVAPSTQAVPDGTQVAPNVTARFQVRPGDVVSWGVSSVGANPGVSQQAIDIDLWDDVSNTRLVNGVASWASGATTFTHTVSASSTYRTQLEIGGNANTTLQGQVSGYFVNQTLSSTPACQFGTQPQPSAAATSVITPALVDLVLTALDLEELAFLFDVIWYSTLNIGQMCSQLPPAAPPIDLSLLTASPSTIQQLFTALAWPHFCQCVAGTPTPVPPISPVGPTNTPWPTQPTFPCADTDVCAALVAMQRQLQALQATLANVWDVSSSVQRYRVPFGYIGGTQHLGLTGEGSISVSRLVGLQIVVTALPVNGKVLQSNPDYFWNLGWISVSDGGGMLQQRRIARQSMTWFPDQMQEASTVGYFLEPDVSISVVELEPEP